MDTKNESLIRNIAVEIIHIYVHWYILCVFSATYVRKHVSVSWLTLSVDTLYKCKYTEET